MVDGELELTAAGLGASWPRSGRRESMADEEPFDRAVTEPVAAAYLASGEMARCEAWRAAGLTEPAGGSRGLW